MTRLAFVTPAHERLALSAICFEQRRRCIAELALLGIDAVSVVVACDRNLDVAREHGMVALDRPNRPLGWKWNEGIAHACRELDADYVVPIGSDDWCLPGWFTDLPAAGTVKSGDRLALMRPDGGEIVGLGLAPGKGPLGYLPWVIPRDLLDRKDGRPAEDDCVYGDVSIAAGVSRRWRDSPFYRARVDELQVVDFKTAGRQCTSFDRTAALNPIAWRDPAPFARLAERYPADLVDRMHEHYQTAGRR